MMGGGASKDVESLDIRKEHIKQRREMIAVEKAKRRRAKNRGIDCENNTM
jgi:hypothetical protein